MFNVCSTWYLDLENNQNNKNKDGQIQSLQTKIITIKEKADAVEASLSAEIEKLNSEDPRVTNKMVQ